MENPKHIDTKKKMSNVMINHTLQANQRHRKKEPPQQAQDVKINVIATLMRRRWYDVVLMLFACWDRTLTVTRKKIKY